MDEATEQASSEAFAYKYRRLRTAVARLVRSDTLGSPVPNGYTTVDQADRIARAIVLAPGDCLLDLGAGRGWPGSRIAALSGCDLVTVDLPLTALREAREHMRRRDIGRAGAVVCGDGARLPFRDACFQAVTHADVLC